MDSLYGLLADISKDLVCKGLNQLQYSLCFNGFVKELEEEENNLTETRENVERRVTDARRQTSKTSEVIDKWLENAKIDSEYVNRLLREANARKSCFFGYCPNWIWRYRLGKKLANKKAELEKIIQEGRQYIQLERIASIPSNTFDILTEKSMNFGSRKYAYDQVMKALKYDGVGTIGLYGMGGCGKTTLAMEVKKIAEAGHLFDKVIFVSVSSTVAIPRIQEKIASSLQYTFPENQEMERAQRLFMRLTQEKNILIILDDVWEKIDFGRIGIPSSEHHKGCKILITTRSEEVCTLMDCQKIIYLPILTDEEAWALFQNKALISKDTPKTIRDLAISISNECKGLPVAIVAVASSLKEKQKDVWRSALNKLKSSKPINIGKGLQDPYKCLQLSYDNLDTKEAKSLLLLCSAFPEDYEIPIEGLIRCAIGLGVVDGFDTYEEARTEVTATKIKLVSSCLLLDVGDKHVKMHDLVRDVAQWIAKNENKVIKCELEKDVTLEHGSMRYLWCVKFPNDMDCSNLEFLSIQTKFEVSDAIFEKMEKLRVLIVSNQNYNNELQLSTMSFKTLQNLRCLVLQYWKLSDISFVRDMKKLQSLSLRRCSLPSFLELETDVGVTQLPNLKLLEFSHCDIERRNFEEIKLIRSLEELYILENYWNGNVEFLNVLPETLKRYGIVLGYNTLYYYSPQLEFCSFHATLALYHFDISNEIIMRMAKSSKELTMGNIEGGAKNIVPDIFQIGASMSELNQLQIHNSEIECLVDTSNHLNKVGNVFSELCSLTITNMWCLRALWHGCVPVDGSFKKLEKLFIENCPKLTFLLTCDMARGLVQLKLLEISDCDILKHIVTNDDNFTKKSEDEFAIGHFEHSKIFQNLEDLEVSKCKELKDVFSAGIIGGLPQLKSLVIQECNMLEQIIGDVIPSVHQDEKEEKDGIIEENEHQLLETNQMIFSSKNSSTPSPPIVNHSSGSFSLSSLAELEIHSCPMLGSLFTTCVAKTLTSLEELTIEECDGLKHIVTPARVKRNKKENMVEDDHEFDSDLSMFSSLKWVTISNCESLEDIFGMAFVGGMMGQQVSLKLEYLSLAYLPRMTHIWVATNNSFTLQHLNSLTIMRCQKLNVIFPRSMLRSLPELNYLQVIGCNELRHVIEDSSIVAYSPRPCFPKLQSLLIERCHKLKCFASVSASNDLSNLKILIIKGATELKAFIGCEYDNTGNTKLQLPQLQLLIFMHLSNFNQETIFLNVKYRIVRNSSKLSLTSTITPHELPQKFSLLEGLENSGIYSWYIESLMDEIQKLDEVSRSNNSTELPSPQELVNATSINSEVDEKSNRVTYSQELVDGKSTTGSYLTDQQNPLGETQSTIKMSHEDPPISEIKSSSSQLNDDNQSMSDSIVEMVGEHKTIETKTLVSKTQEFQKIHRKSEMTSDPQAMDQNFPLISSPNMTQLTDETEANNIGKTTTSDKLAIPTSVLENIEEIGRQRKPATEGATIKQDSQVVKQNNEMNEEKTEIGIVSNNRVEVTPDPRTRLEKYKKFVDLNDSQISLLVEAIAAYPHLWNSCEKFNDRFRAWMLKTLADMLLFLRSESVGSVDPEREKEFLELCDEAVQLGFERSWVDDMRQRVVGRDHKLEHARAQIGELLKRHHHLTQELDSIKVPIGELVKRHDHLTQELHNMKKELRSINDSFDAPTKCFDFL